MHGEPKKASPPRLRFAALTSAAASVLRSRTHRLLWREVGWPVAGLAIALAGIVIAGALARPRSGPVWLWIDIGLVAAAVVLVALLLARIAAHLIEPLAHLRRWAQELRSGHFASRMPEMDGAEFGELARDINRLASWLESMTLAMDHQVRAQTLRLARKSQSLDILYDVTASLNRPGGLDKQLENFLDTFIALVDGLAASVWLRSEDGAMRLVASRGQDAAYANERLCNHGCPHCGWEVASGRIHMQHGRDLTCARVTPPQILDSQFRELIAIPVRYQENTLGVYCLLLDRPVSSLGEDAPDLLIAIARHLGLAIVKANLDNDARRLAIMEERQLIGHELHDSLAQALVGMRLQIKMLGESLHRKEWRSAQNEVRNLKSAADEAHSSLRELLANFRLKMDDRGLVPALRDLVERFRQETSIAVFFQNECTELDITPAQEIQVFHIIQEALANIRKHSGAHNARILLSRNADGRYSVLIEDDGLGMGAPSDGQPQPGEHLGLSIMRERAERLPGDLTIESEAGEGTRLVLTFPVAREQRARATGR
jgi:two-component system nitrate/nitrite sensor histidine kinase NarX